MAAKTRPQLTLDRDTYELARALAREDGGTISGLVRTMLRQAACSHFGKSTVREVKALLASSEPTLERRGGAA